MSYVEHPRASRKKAGRKAKVTLPPWITGIKGRLDNVVFRVSQNGETSVTRSPDMSAVGWSQAQEAHRQRFKAAIAYAKAAMSNPDARAVSEKQAAEQNRRPFRLAVSDYLKGNDLLSGKVRLKRLAEKAY